ncbi:nicotinate-nucleotide diphosphorylase (carboxylating) [Leptolyngbya sp. BL0902]|uniref:carboxylating nicotinate-nucleotide diphosphorylase n=1 Tax=Leptolyngbya sp. BL0902 TaxID=1115757 RepID=UPI0018E83147|nr:carboxylating nicotinate-nucleotide diphosphorylase [Leptolyngbya sp. BL0902]QQE67181.1 nicotinate-nucleotide diphosphorylase (carboxylating) [Leptolyngbya sp. BL0902]
MPSDLPLSLPAILLDPPLQSWLQEDIGRGDWSTAGLGDLARRPGEAIWVAKAPGIIAGLPVAARVFHLLDPASRFDPQVAEGTFCEPGTVVAKLRGSLGTLLMGERVALNLAMRLSGIATATRQYVEALADSPTQFVDTRKTTPGLRLLEKYATRVGGACNHRLGLDDAVMIKDNHIAAAGGIRAAVEQVRKAIPYTLNIEVETSDLDQVNEALDCGVDIIMLDNMPPDLMAVAVQMIRQANPRIRIEASGNVTLDTLRPIAETGVDFISSSAPITRAPWLDLSMRMVE